LNTLVIVGVPVEPLPTLMEPRAMFVASTTPDAASRG
jgi:hypothetical protein